MCIPSSGRSIDTSEWFAFHGVPSVYRSTLMNERTTSETITACDIYSLGASVWEIASGVSLLHNETAQAMLHAGAVDPIEGLSEPLRQLIVVGDACTHAPVPSCCRDASVCAM